MNSPSSSSDDYISISGTRPQTLQRVPEQLYQQARLATYLLIGTWFFVSFPVFLLAENKPVACFTLLPGLAIAAYISYTLSLSLTKNHRDDEQKNIFPNLGAGNWITLLRAAMVVAFACLLPMTYQYRLQWENLLGWFAGGLYLIISLADLLDGYAARKQQRVTELGKKLDIETDAAGLLAASIVAILSGRLPVIYLLVALAYYLFIVGIWWRKQQGLPVAELVHRPYGRIIAGCQMGLVAMVLFPVFASMYTHIGAVIFMIPFLLGFLRDWLVVSCRVRTDDNQRCHLDGLWSDRLNSGVSLLARLLIALSGLLLLLTRHPSEIDLGWLTGYCIFGFLVVMGCLGRSAALLLLLLLGLNVSPFGFTFLATVNFISATTLFLSGSGPFSLWAPEEDILYRRSTEPEQNQGQV